MPSVRLTAKSLDALRAKATRVDYFDEGASVPGFGLRVSAAGKKTWFLMYRASGVQKRHTLGTYPPMGLEKARATARTALLNVSASRPIRSTWRRTGGTSARRSGRPGADC
jgi:hypothetical protein